MAADPMVSIAAALMEFCNGAMPGLQIQCLHPLADHLRQHSVLHLGLPARPQDKCLTNDLRTLAAAACLIAGSED